MTEAAVAFQQTNRERSIVKNSAYHKKGGSAVAKLGNKRMNWQEINERHGECKTYTTDGFIEYADFEKLPWDLKIEYVNKLMNEYDVGLNHISQYLFNKGGDGLKANLRKEKVDINGKGTMKTLLELTEYQKSRANTGLLKFRADVDEWKRRCQQLTKLEAMAKEEKMNTPAEFITYDQFTSMCIQDQLLYVNKLITQWGVGIDTISIELFKKSKNTLRMRFQPEKLKNAGIQDQIQKIALANPHAHKELNEKFIQAVKEWKNAKATANEESVNVKAVDTILKLGIAGEEPEEKKETAIKAAKTADTRKELINLGIMKKEAKPVEEEIKEIGEENMEKSDIAASSKSNAEDAAIEPAMEPDEASYSAAVQGGFTGTYANLRMIESLAELDYLAEESLKKCATFDSDPKPEVEVKPEETGDKYFCDFNISKGIVDHTYEGTVPQQKPIGYVINKMEYCDQSYTLSCISKGLDMQRIQLINMLFADEMIKWELSITNI